MKPVKIFILIIASSILLSGCIAVDGYFKGVRNNVLSSVEGHFEKEIEFSLGAAAITLSGVVVSFSDAPEFTSEMLHKIDRIQIGVYENKDWRSFKPNFQSIKKITDDLREDGYEFIVRSVDRDEMVIVTVKNDTDRIHEMFVVALSDEDLVITQIFGELDEIIQIAIREQGFNVEVAHR